MNNNVPFSSRSLVQNKARGPKKKGWDAVKSEKIRNTMNHTRGSTALLQQRMWYGQDYSIGIVYSSLTTYCAWAPCDEISDERLLLLHVRHSSLSI